MAVQKVRTPRGEMWVDDQGNIWDATRQRWFNPDSGLYGNPATNRWYDPQTGEEFQTSLRPPPPKPKEPNPLETVGLLGGMALAQSGGRMLGEKAPDIFSGLFGSGSSGASAATPAASAAAPTSGGMASLGSALSSGSAPAAPSVVGASFEPATAAAAPATGGMFSLGGIGSAGNAYLPIAGAYGMYDLLKKDEQSELKGGLQGAASGAAIGSYFGLPGALIGGGIGGTVGAGKAFLTHSPNTRKEEARWRNLGEQGAAVPDWVSQGQDIKDPNAWYRSDLAADFVGTANDGQWVNNKFAKSRNASDLTGKDIWGYAAFAEKFGPKWMEISPDAREAIANEALKQGAVKEHHGTVDVNWNPELEKAASDYISGARKPEVAPAAPAPASPSPTTPSPSPGTTVGKVAELAQTDASDPVARFLKDRTKKKPSGGRRGRDSLTSFLSARNAPPAPPPTSGGFSSLGRFFEQRKGARVL